ncbi:MAG: YdcF family protein [Anaerolineae bacterium]|nr:YdcF family protein [Anaerolineae bacterium]
MSCCKNGIKTPSPKLIMAVSQQEAERITHYLDVHTTAPGHADLLFVFGTRHAEPAHIAANLFKRRLAPYIVLTGGSNRLTGIIEADAHLEILLTEGIPREAIILEHTSTNTLENVCYALPMVEQYMVLDRIKSIVVITKWYHCRRATMTLKRHLPTSIRYYAATYEPQGINRSSWWQSKVGCQPVLKEIHRIPTYLTAGDIEEIQDRNGFYS